MKFEILKRGINKDECFCGKAKDIKDILEQLDLNSSFDVVLNMGDIISREKNTKIFIFEFSFYTRLEEYVSKYKDVSRYNIWFSFYPVKKKEITEKIRDDFKNKIIPLLKSEIVACMQKNNIIEFGSTIKVFIDNKELLILQESR